MPFRRKSIFLHEEFLRDGITYIAYGEAFGDTVAHETATPLMTEIWTYTGTLTGPVKPCRGLALLEIRAYN